MKDGAFDLIDALHAPILTFSASWADSIPDRLKQIMPLARMAALIKGEEMATYPEIVAYLITRSHEAPMDYEWTDIYTHVSCKVCEQWFQEDHWEAVRAPKELSTWLQGQLDDLRRHIYRKRRERLKKQINENKKRA